MTPTCSIAVLLQLLGLAGAVYLVAGPVWHSFVRRPMATRIRR